jgi:hypothetical protein
MAFVIKALGSGTYMATGTKDLYVVPVPKSALVTSVRLANGSTTNSTTVNLSVFPSAGGSARIAEKDYVIAVGAMLLMEDIVTLGQGDKIQMAVAGTSPTVGYMVNGVERD